MKDSMSLVEAPPSAEAISEAEGRINHEAAVLERYSAGARRREAELCCPARYDPQYLEAIPEEIRELDYGCGDPSIYIGEGERVLDLGSGAGKICYILSQKVGPGGWVTGVDMNDVMLGLARRHQRAFAERIGWANLEFKKGRIQDLKTDIETLEIWLAERPVRDFGTLMALEDYQRRQRESRPLIADGVYDALVSSCVLNLVPPEAKPALFEEMFRVLRRGGRAVISDIVADEDVPQCLQNNPELWSGCIAGALREDRFLEAFERAGFHGVQILEWDREPWRTVEGIEFRSVTVVAWKGKQGPCVEKNQAVIYKGPFQSVEDDDGHRFRRGQRVAVCEKTFGLLQRGAYADQMIFIEPREPVTEPREFDCRRSARRDPRETKGQDYEATTEAQGSCCGPGACC